MAASEVETWMRVLRNADAAGDTAAAQRAAQRVRELRSAPAAPSRPDQFAGDDLLSNEAMAKLSAGAQSTVTPSPEPGFFDGLKRYGRRIDEAAGRVNAAGQSPLGTVEALGTLVTGALAPIPGTLVSLDDVIAGREADPEEAFSRFTYQPRTESGKAKLGLLGAVASPLTESGADVALAPLAAESRTLGTPARVPKDVAGSTPGRRAGARVGEPLGNAVEAGANEAKLAQAAKNPPSLEELDAAAKAAYKRADEAGITLSEGSIKGLKTRIVREIGERADPTLHPDTTAALKRILGTEGDLTLSKLDQLRQIANDAKGSVKPADQRLAAKIVDSIDDYIANLSEKDVTSGKVKDASALKEARNLYSRKMKAEEIGELFRRAEIKAGANYTQSGLENALRGEFKALALNKNRMRRFSTDERAAIEKVAKGGKLENAFRYLGKFAPTGVVSATLSGGLGAMLAGPAGAAVPLAGMAGRAAATRMTLRNARRADEIMRRGPQQNSIAPKKRNKLSELTY